MGRPVSPSPPEQDRPDWTDDVASPYPPAAVGPARVEAAAPADPRWQTTEAPSAAARAGDHADQAGLDTAPVPVTPAGALDPPALPAPPEPASLVLGTTAPAPVRPDRRPVAPARSGPAHRHRRRFRFARTAAAAAVLLVVTALALTALFGQKGGQPRPTAALLSPPTTVAPPPPPSTPPTTTMPAVLVSSDTQGARYSLLGSVVIDLVPSSPCWVEIRTGSASGTLVYQGVLNPGDRHPVPANSPVWLRLGNPPAVTVVINGTPLQPPAHATSQPYNLSFERATTG